MNETTSLPKRPKRNRRSIKLIQPALQLRLVAWFAGMTAVALIGQFLLLSSRLTEFAARMPQGGNYLVDGMHQFLTEILLFSFGMLLPAVLLIGIHATFRLAGPIYRFKQHLSAVAEGEETGPCRIRKGDQLQDLCELINAALERAREREDGARHASEPEVPASAATREQDKLAA